MLLQGPKKSSMSHFWQMIWQQTDDVAVIIMLTPTEESGREKCFQYFPLDSESSPFKVSATGHPDHPVEGEVSFDETEEGHGSHTHVRKLSLTFGTETRVVWHLLFTAFPDFGIPEDDDRAELLDLVRLSAEKNSKPSNPRTVHCSAGVGRSGTFIALEYLLSLLNAGKVAKIKDEQDPIFDLVHDLRGQRMMMVQSEPQFYFLYEVLTEELEKKQAAAQLAGQPSPKMRKLAGGMKAAMLDESEYLNESNTPKIQINSAERGLLGEDTDPIKHHSAPPGLELEQIKTVSSAEIKEPSKEDGQKVPADLKKSNEDGTPDGKGQTEGP